MKKTILALTICIASLTCFSQSKKPVTENLNTSPGTLKVQMDTSYVLNGKLPDFELLYLAIISPGDVTPNQKNALAAWIKKIQMIQLPIKEEKEN